MKQIQLTRFAFIVAFMLPVIVFSQVNAGRDTVSCGEPITLTGTIFPRPSTTSYTASVIPFAPLDFTSGINLPLTDDGFTNPLPIGFPFCFFGQVYTQFHISANGWMSFTPNNQFAQVNNNPSSFPSTSNNVPKNAIAIWQDWNPPQGGTINYYTTGIIPNRKLVVNWNNVPHYQCVGQNLKAQVILYEGTNVIEYHVETKGTCPTWQSGNATQGLHNLSGTQAFTVPGRNAAVFSLTNDAYRFSPSGPPEPTTIKWFDITSGGPPVATGNSFSVNPVNTNSYRIEVTYGCSPGVFSDTVIVDVDKTEIFTSSTEVKCFGGNDGTATVIVTGSAPPYDYSWSTSATDTNANITGLTANEYQVSVTHGYCVFTEKVTVGEPAEMILSTTVSAESCGDTNGIAVALASGGEGPYQYSWNTAVINDSLINVAEGTYSVTVTDQNGCTKTAQAEIEQVSNVLAGFSPSVTAGPAPLSVTFTNTSTGAETFFWDLGNGSSSTALNSSTIYTDPGVYTVILTAVHESICNDEVSVNITVTNDSVPETETVIIPNVLIPNSQVEKNRIFKLNGANLEAVNIKIFNRWGNDVFSSSDPSQGWNGGSEPAGTYYYIVSYNERGKEMITAKGFISLFR